MSSRETSYRSERAHIFSITHITSLLDEGDLDVVFYVESRDRDDLRLGRIRSIGTVVLKWISEIVRWSDCCICDVPSFRKNSQRRISS